MISQRTDYNSKLRLVLGHYLETVFVPHAHSIIMGGALFCTLIVKLFHALRFGPAGDYISWILADVAVLLAVELVLSSLCLFRPNKWTARVTTIIAAVVCTWSVMNAGWLIRTGTQILPHVLLPLLRAPVSALFMIGVNLAKMPAASFMLLGPSAVALAFFFFALARPVPPIYQRRRFLVRAVVSLTIILAALTTRATMTVKGSSQSASSGLRYNAQLRAVMNLVLPEHESGARPKRQIPAFDEVVAKHNDGGVRRNVIIVVLEGIQYHYTSLADRENGLTPYLASIADDGVEFSNTRSCLTHTTKALFALLTGRFPSASQDIVEAVPSQKPYVSAATILREELGHRTAFFQSAKGGFEARPGLVHNLGYEKFWARDDMTDPNAFLGYLGADEFSMLEPVSQWLREDDGPFFLTILCSATHDPYEVPEWFGAPATEPLERYRQAIFYTDKFLEALDVELVNLNLLDDTVLCVIGDHGEGFGEHGLLGHERNAFDEVLRIPFCMRAPFLLEPGERIARAVSSIDLTPTLLGLLGFKVDSLGFDGRNVLICSSEQRKVYFCGWMQEGPAGFIEGDHKYIYNPSNETVSVCDLRADPHELTRTELPPGSAQQIAEEIIGWRTNTLFRLNQQKAGRMLLYGRWRCRWTGRVSSARYDK